MSQTWLLAEKIFMADYLGVVPYAQALRWQQKSVRARSEGIIPDVLLLLQHPPVFTFGRFRGQADIVTPLRDVENFPTDRGGSVTYHGPGQLVGYPILDLKAAGLGVRQYIRKLEEVIINLLLGMGITGHQAGQYPGGVWVDEDKICSIGIHVSRGVTSHGFALNVDPDLRYFSCIRPCGLDGTAMTSISRILGYPVEVEAISSNLINSFVQVFGWKRAALTFPLSTY
jgi:lipoate-protein ligase B